VAAHVAADEHIAVIMRGYAWFKLRTAATGAYYAPSVFVTGGDVSWHWISSYRPLQAFLSPTKNENWLTSWYDFRTS